MACTIHRTPPRVGYLSKIIAGREEGGNGTYRKVEVGGGGGGEA